MRLALKALLLDHAAEVLDVVAEHELAESLVPVPLGVDSVADCDRRAELQRAATREAQAIVARERSGQSARPPFRGALDALRQLDRIDGVPIPGIDLDPKSTGRPEKASSTVDRLAIPGREWAACFGGGWSATIVTTTCRLTQQQAQQVTVWSVLGFGHVVRPVQDPMPLVEGKEGALRQKPAQPIAVRGRFDEGWRGGFDRHHVPDADEVAAYASKQFGQALSVPHALRVRLDGITEFYRRLHSRGLVPLDRRMAMATQDEAEPYDLVGWKAIGAFLGIGERAAMRWQADGLPHYEFQRMIVARKSELRAWQASRMKPRATAKT